MTQEDKELLLKDLCARLPYGVKVWVKTHHGQIIKSDFLTLCNGGGYYSTLSYEGILDDSIVMPYLRPMSSMTEKEKKDLLNYVVGKDSKYFEVCGDGSITDMSPDEQDFRTFELKWINFHPNTTSRYIGWLLKNHFDFCDLIPKCLALEAPEGMYK